MASDNYIAQNYVARTFPGFSFFGVQFRQYPVSIYPPEGTDLEESNLFMVQDGVVTFLVDSGGLGTFFANQLGPVPDPEAAKDAGRSWLCLSEELEQDLFFTFSVPDVQYEAGQDGAVVSGQVLVLNGGTGAIAVRMSFDAGGNLVDVNESSTVRAGVRPICQATKLLDRDPLVRRMAEQDILVMGSAAKSYLQQQRGKARPALKRAIDRLWDRIVREGR